MRWPNDPSESALYCAYRYRDILFAFLSGIPPYVALLRKTGFVLVWPFSVPVGNSWKRSLVRELQATISIPIHAEVKFCLRSRIPYSLRAVALVMEHEEPSLGVESGLALYDGHYERPHLAPPSIKCPICGQEVILNVRRLLVLSGIALMLSAKLFDIEWHSLSLGMLDFQLGVFVTSLGLGGFVHWCRNCKRPRLFHARPKRFIVATKAKDQRSKWNPKN